MENLNKFSVNKIVGKAKVRQLFCYSCNISHMTLLSAMHFFCFRANLPAYKLYSQVGIERKFFLVEFRDF